MTCLPVCTSISTRYVTVSKNIDIPLPFGYLNLNATIRIPIIQFATQWNNNTIQLEPEDNVSNHSDVK